MSTWKPAYVDSGASMHTEMVDSVLFLNMKPSSNSIRELSAELVKAKDEGASEV